MCVCCICLCLFVGFHSLPVTYQYSNGTKLYIARADAISLVAHNPGSNGILLQMICDVDPVQLPRHFVLGLSMCAPVTCFEPSVRGLINERHNHPQSTWCSFLTVIFLANTLFFRLRIRLQKKAKKKIDAQDFIKLSVSGAQSLHIPNEAQSLPYPFLSWHLSSIILTIRIKDTPLLLVTS